MSTRCQIGFYQPEAVSLVDFVALIYRHNDGYPGKVNKAGEELDYGVLSHILPILRDFNKNRGLGDVEYASAWLVAKLKDNYLDIGICRTFHFDIEYFYAVYPDRIDVYETHMESRWESWKIIKTVKV